MSSKGDFNGQPGAFAIIRVDEVAHVGPGHVWTGRNSEEVGGGFGHRCDVGSPVPTPIAKPRCIKCEFQTLRSFVERAACLFLFRDVARDFGSADGLAVRTFDR